MLIKPGDTVWYTDRSKTKQGTGPGTNGLNPKRCISFGRHCALSSIFRYVQWPSDSQASIKALEPYRDFPSKNLPVRIRKSNWETSWRLHPRITFGTYTADIRPMIPYAAMDWWPKVGQGLKARQCALTGMYSYYRCNVWYSRVSNPWTCSLWGKLEWVHTDSTRLQVTGDILRENTPVWASWWKKTVGACRQTILWCQIINTSFWNDSTFARWWVWRIGLRFLATNHRCVGFAGLIQLSSVW